MGRQSGITSNRVSYGRTSKFAFSRVLGPSKRKYKKKSYKKKKFFSSGKRVPRASSSHYKKKKGSSALYGGKFGGHFAGLSAGTHQRMRLNKYVYQHIARPPAPTSQRPSPYHYLVGFNNYPVNSTRNSSFTNSSVSAALAASNPGAPPKVEQSATSGTCSYWDYFVGTCR